MGLTVEKSQTAATNHFNAQNESSLSHPKVAPNKSRWKRSVRLTQISSLFRCIRGVYATSFSSHGIHFLSILTQIEKSHNEAPLEQEDGQVQEPVVTRYGRCLLYKIDRHGTNLKEKQRFDGPAILDMKWSRSSPTLALANARGIVELHSYSASSQSLSLSQSLTLAPSSTLCLSLDWSDRRPSSSSPEIVVSLSDGSISLLTPSEASYEVERNWKAHDYEPWIAGFDCWNSNTVWTGGDDCKLKGWDLRQGCDSPTFVNKRFEGGVTTLQSHPLREHLFAVGSYDGLIRLFDTRNPLKPLSTHVASGGIWRLKWHATNPDRILVAAMHGGFQMVDFDENGQGRDWARFDGHESLAYGVDWSGMTNEEGKDIVASCSFYDHLVHVWAA